MKKYTVAVFFGGCSPEYSVSLESAYAVMQGLDKSRYQVVPVGITQNGKWFYFHGDMEKIKQDKWQQIEDCTPVVLSPNRGEGRLWLMEGDQWSYMTVDIGFPVLHGKNGEDGTIQGLLKLAGIPVAGCGVLASALCMDKDRAHKLAAAAGIRVPKSIVLEKEEPVAAEKFVSQIGYPVYVKPVKAGSSYGITKVQKEEELMRAIQTAFQFDDQVIIEENIDGFEVGCAVLGNDCLTVGEVDEIELSKGFFNFTEKYTLQTSAIHVPARISEEKAHSIRQTAKQIYRTLGCRGFARVDMFLTPDGDIVFNEVNTIPGFTEHSRYPGMMKAAGFSFREILTQILELAIKPSEAIQ